MTTGKVPVFRSVGAGLHFAFLRLFSLLRGGLLPILLYVPSLAVYQWYVSPAPGALDPNAVTFATVAYIVLVLSGLMLTVGTTKAYFREPMGPLYLWFGAAELRMIAAYILVLLLLMLIIGGLAFLAMFALGGFSMPLPTPVISDSVFALEKEEQIINGALPILIGIGVFLFFLTWFVYLRFALIVPVIVKEKRIGLRRSWRLMRGNVWRMLGLIIVLSIVLALIIALGVGGAAFTPLGAYVGGLIQAASDGTLELSMLINELGFAVLALITLGYLLMCGVSIGALGRAYEAAAESDDALSEPQANE